MKKYDEMRKYKYCLPFHLQSKSLGECMIDYLDLSSESTIESTFNKGTLDFAHPGKYLKLPSYIVNKLMYKNVSTKNFDEPRISVVTGKPLYDRELSDFGRKYLKLVFKNRIIRQSQKIKQFYDNLVSFSMYLPLLGIDVHNIQDTLNTAKMVVPNLFEKLSCYHCLVRDISVLPLAYFGDYDHSKVFSPSWLASYYVRTKDTKYLREHNNMFSHKNSISLKLANISVALKS